MAGLCGEHGWSPPSALASVVSEKPAHARQQMPAPPAHRPNILVIFGDDIGISNLSTYAGGL